MRGREHKDCGTLSSLGRFTFTGRIQQGSISSTWAFQEQWDAHAVYFLTHGHKLRPQNENSHSKKK